MRVQRDKPFKEMDGQPESVKKFLRLVSSRIMFIKFEVAMSAIKWCLKRHAYPIFPPSGTHFPSPFVTRICITFFEAQ